MPTDPPPQYKAAESSADWFRRQRETLERVRHTIVKRYNAEIHSQATIEGVLELYQNVTQTLREINRTLWHISAAVIAVLTLLFFLHNRIPSPWHKEFQGHSTQPER